MVYPSARIARGKLTLRLVEAAGLKHAYGLRSSDQPAPFISFCRSSANKAALSSVWWSHRRDGGGGDGGREGEGVQDLREKQVPKHLAKERDDFR